MRSENVNETLLVEHIRMIRDISIRLNPGTAIMIMDGGAETIIENNDIVGVISLYGIYGKAVLTNDDLQALSGLIIDQDVSFSESLGALQLRNNRLTRLVISKDMVDRIKKVISDQEGELEGMYRRSFLTENSIESGDNQFLSQHLLLTSNSFEILGVEAVTGTALQKVAGTAIGQSTIFMGNYAFEPQTVLYNISRESAKAANLTIEIQDVEG